MASPQTPIVLVHGAWHGAWAWDLVRQALERTGHDVRSVELPGQGRSPGRDDLHGHSQYLRDYLDACDAPPLVVAHSYGGAVVTQALDLSISITRVLMVAAFMLESGESCISVNDSAGHSESGDDSFHRSDHYVSMPPDAARAAFYGDVPADLTETAIGRLNAENRDTIYEPVSRAGWRDFPTSYVECLRDKALLPEIQARMAARADSCYRLDTSHSPMLSAVEELSAIISAESRRIR